MEHEKDICESFGSEQIWLNYFTDNLCIIKKILDIITI